MPAHIEYFKDKYGGVPKWIDDQTYYTFFTEGWGLYSENPVISDDTDTYKENPMQKFGMLKWQVCLLQFLISLFLVHLPGRKSTTFCRTVIYSSRMSMGCVWHECRRPLLPAGQIRTLAARVSGNVFACGDLIHRSQRS